MQRLPIHQGIKEKLDHFMASNRIPHMLFYGPSGCGKKTVLHEFLRKIYRENAQTMKTNVMYVNCAHGKGIKFIRDDLKFFAKTNVHLNGGFSFKCVVLLNAEQLTVDAQSALRRCIEIYSDNTRFFIIVKNKQKLLQPILSRFCEMYVPLPTHPIKHVPMNLHQWNLQQVFSGFCTELEKGKLETIHQLYETHCASFTEPSHMICVQFVKELYDHAISSYDLLQYINEYGNRWDDYEKSNCVMCFSKIKSEYRCEKMLMLYIMDFMYHRSTTDLTDSAFL